MAKTVSADAFASAISKTLEKYRDNVQENLADIVKDLSKKGAKEIKSRAQSTFNGRDYASGWTSRFDGGRVSSQGIIYNGKYPGLPHLLENGHANRGGGRTPGRAHIAPVEQEIVKQFENEVKSKL